MTQTLAGVPCSLDRMPRKPGPDSIAIVEAGYDLNITDERRLGASPTN
jgi:hypothetical protein